MRFGVTKDVKGERRTRRPHVEDISRVHKDLIEIKGQRGNFERESKQEIRANTGNLWVFYLWLRGRKPSGLDYRKILHGHSWVHMMNSIIKRNTLTQVVRNNRQMTTPHRDNACLSTKNRRRNIEQSKAKI